MTAAAETPIHAAAPLAALLAQVAATDTVVAIQAHTGLDRWANVALSIATIVVAVALLVVAAAMIVAVLAIRRMVGQLRQVLDRVRGDVDPIVKHAVSVSDNVDYITTSLRGDVQKLNATVSATTRRLESAAAVAERRIGDFNALLEVVQEEAEDLFVSTASTVRGVQVGTEAFRRFRSSRDGYDPYAGGADDLAEPSDVLDEDDRGPATPPRPRGGAR